MNRSNSILDLTSSAESYRLSCIFLFKQNLCDFQLHIAILACFLVTRLIVGRPCESVLAFLLVFGVFFYLVNQHMESYRNFKLVRGILETYPPDDVRLLSFLRVCLDRDTQYGRSVRGSLDIASSLPLARQAQVGSAVLLQPLEERQDTFGWLNRIIAFIWPYLSLVVHSELNKFFVKQIKSGNLAQSEASSRRLLYAVVKQLDTNISCIEHCELGKQWPIINDLRVTESSTEQLVESNRPKTKSALSRKKGKVLICDIDLHYNGDVNISIIYKYFCCCSSRFGLKDIFLHFKPRIVLGPIGKRSPFVEELAFTLLQLPKFGYKGIAMVELAELRVVRRLINNLIVEHILQPRVLVVSLGKLIERHLHGKPISRFSGNKPAASGDIIKFTKADENSGSERRQPSFWTNITARMLLCSCMCSNVLLRLFQKAEGSSGRQTVKRSLSPDGHRSFTPSRKIIEQFQPAGTKQLWPE